MNIQNTLAAQLYSSAQKATDAAPAGPEMADHSFAEAVERVLSDLQTTIDTGERTAAKAVAGQADIQSMVEALTATEMALETAVTVRDKVVEAYQELLRMPV